jgi:hypothetical protein
MQDDKKSKTCSPSRRPRGNGNAIYAWGEMAVVESMYSDMAVVNTTTQVVAYGRSNQPGSKHCALHSPQGTIDPGCTRLLVANVPGIDSQEALGYRENQGQGEP